MRSAFSSSIFFQFTVLGPPCPPPLPPPIMGLNRTNHSANPSTPINNDKIVIMDPIENVNNSNNNSDALDSDSGLEVVEEPTLRPSELVRGNHNRTMSTISGKFQMNLIQSSIVRKTKISSVTNKFRIYHGRSNETSNTYSI